MQLFEISLLIVGLAVGAVGVASWVQARKTLSEQPKHNG